MKAQESSACQAVSQEKTGDLVGEKPSVSYGISGFSTGGFTAPPVMNKSPNHIRWHSGPLTGKGSISVFVTEIFLVSRSLTEITSQHYSWCLSGMNILIRRTSLAGAMLTSTRQTRSRLKWTWATLRECCGEGYPS